MGALVDREIGNCRESPQILVIIVQIFHVVCDHFCRCECECYVVGMYVLYCTVCVCVSCVMFVRSDNDIVLLSKAPLLAGL